MTKETSTPDSLKAQIAEAPANTTVFSDGSTFDYENGYKSNGASVTTRDRIENPTIVKSHKVVTAGRVLGVLSSLLILTLLMAIVHTGVASFQAAENWKALKAGVNDSGQVEVVQGIGHGILVKSPEGKMFKCDTSFISNGGNPLGLVFCEPGGPATFSIPLPHDPANVFYTTADKEEKK